MDQQPNTAEPQKPRGRWFQFRLRTMLIVVVLIGSACGYVAHEARIVAARKAWLALHPQIIQWQPMHGAPSSKGVWWSAEPEQATLIRRWLGDNQYPKILVMSSDDVPQAKLLFPEAAIVEAADVFDQHHLPAGF